MDEFQELGGSYIYLKSGQGVVIPPLRMIGQLNAFNLENCPSEGESEINADILDSRLSQHVGLSWSLSIPECSSQDVCIEKHPTPSPVGVIQVKFCSVSVSVSI